MNMMGSGKFYYFGLPFVIFFITPGFLINDNLRDLWYLDPLLLILFAGIAFVVAVAILCLVDFGIGQTRLKTYFLASVKFVFFFVLISGIFAPASLSSELVEPRTIPLNPVNISIVTIVSLLLLIFSNSTINNTLHTGVLSVLAMSTFIAAYGIFSLKESNEAENKRALGISNNNIFVISFDGIPRDIAIEAIKKSARFQRDFVDFIAFENVISSSPATTASIAAELYGNQNFKNSAQAANDLWLFDPDRLLTNLLDRHGYNTSTFFSYALGFQNEQRIIDERMLIDRSLMTFSGRVIGILDFYDYVFVRFGSRYTVRAMHKLYRVIGLHAIIDNIGSSLGSDKGSALFEKAKRSHGPQWDRPQNLQKLAYDGYLKKLHVAPLNQKVAHFLHFAHTHYPVDFDSECKFRSDDKKWYDAHQNRAGVEAEVHCALTQLASFIERLKDLGVYDGSLIVLKSDHGKPASYYDQDRLESFKIRDHKHWGYGRYTPLLLIKPFDSNFEAIKYNEEAVMLDDLARTLCVNSGIHDCSDYPGFDLLSPNLKVPDTATSVLFIVRDKTSSHRYSSHEALLLRRKKDFFENIHSNLLGEFVTKPLACESRVLFDNAKSFNNGFSDYRSWVTWKNGNSYFLRFNMKQCALGFDLLLALKDFDEEHADLHVFVNDKITPADLRDVDHEGGPQFGNANYRLNIQPKLLDKSGSNTLQLTLLDKEGKADLSFVGIKFEE